MSKKTKPDQRRRDLVREALLVGVLAAQAVLLVALVTYAPAPGAQKHLVGVVGRFLAEAIWTAFGAVSFVLLALGVFTTVLALVRRTISAPWLRLVGGLMMLVGSCALVHQVLRPQVTYANPALIHPFDLAPGGWLGAFTFETIIVPVGHFGALVFAVVVMCTGFAFATDWLLYEVLYSAARKGAAATSVLRRFWPAPATLMAGVQALKILPTGSERSRETGRPAKAQNPARKSPGAMGTGSAVAVAEPPEAELAEPIAPPTPAPAPRKASKKAAPASGADIAEDEIRDAAPPSQATATDDAPVLEDPEVLVPPGMLPGRAAAEFTEPAAPVREPAPAVPEQHVEEPVHAVLQVKLEPQIQPPQPAELQLPRTQGEYQFPGLDLLDTPKPRDLRSLERAIQSNADVLQRTLAEFKVDGRVVAYQQGPVVTMLEIALAPGTKVTKIHVLADDLAMALKVQSVRIVAPIPGKSTVGVEIPNPIRDEVRMLTILESPEFRDGKQHIPLLLGTRGNGDPMVDDLTTMPHLLLAGATGSGKSVCINTILLSVLMSRTPDEVKLILIDPKQVELAFFADIPHLLSPVVTDMKRASSILEWAVEKMEERYDLLRRFEVRNIASYNELGAEAIKERIEELGLSDEVIPARLPYIVIIVDELADLMLTAGKEVEKLITRLAQKSRAVGIHIILATQRPSTDVITGLIKANMPTRIAFQVTSKVDSRVVLDQNGADKLLGMGDMLYLPPRSAGLVRAQCTFASDKEVKRVVGFLKQRYTQEFNEELVEIGSAELLDESEKDNLYDEAVRVVLDERRGSASLLQRALAIGYTRASRLLDLMRKEGVVGAYKGSKASDVLLTLEQYEQRVAQRRAARGED